jgi:hypothetical protein
MSAPHSIARATPRPRIGLGTVLTALGVLITIAVAIIILTATAATHTTAAGPGQHPGVGGYSLSTLKGSSAAIGRAQGIRITVPKYHAVTPSPAGGASIPHTHYLGPRQLRATLATHTAQPYRVNITGAQGSGTSAAHYTCLGASKGCLR